MKILQLIHSAGNGGTELYTKSISRRLELLGHQVKTLVGWPGLEPWCELVKGFDPDIVQIQHLHGFPIPCLSIVKSRGTPIVMKLDDAFMFCARNHLLDAQGNACTGPAMVKCNACMGDEKYLHRAAEIGQLVDMVDVFTAPSLWLMREVTAHFGEKIEPKLIHIKTGIEPFNPVIRIGFAGAWVRRKGAHIFMDLIELANKEHPGRFSFHIWGGAYQSALDEARRLEKIVDVHKNVSFYGPYTQDMRAQVFQSMDILAFPSLAENYPFVIREAIIAGVRVHAFNVGAVEEIAGVNVCHENTSDCLYRSIANSLNTRMVDGEAKNYERIYNNLIKKENVNELQ